MSDYAPGTVTLERRWIDFTDGIVAWTATFQPWQIAIQAGIPLLIIIAFWSALRQRRARKSRPPTFPVTGQRPDERQS